MKAVLRQVRISPKKANIVATMVQGKSVSEADEILKYLPKKAAKILRRVITSATANAQNNLGQDTSKLMIKRILVTKGPQNKRWIPVSRGRANPLLKRTSHITVELSA